MGFPRLFQLAAGSRDELENVRLGHVIAEEYGEALGEAGSDHLQRIGRATQKMGTLIDNLLDLDRLSRQELRPHDVDLSRTVAELAQELGEAQPSR